MKTFFRNFMTKILAESLPYTSTEINIDEENLLGKKSFVGRWPPRMDGPRIFRP